MTQTSWPGRNEGQSAGTTDWLQDQSRVEVFGAMVSALQGHKLLAVWGVGCFHFEITRATGPQQANKARVCPRAHWFTAHWLTGSLPAAPRWAPWKPLASRRHPTPPGSQNPHHESATLSRPWISGNLDTPECWRRRTPIRRPCGTCNLPPSCISDPAHHQSHASTSQAPCLIRPRPVVGEHEYEARASCLCFPVRQEPAPPSSVPCRSKTPQSIGQFDDRANFLKEVDAGESI